MIFEYDSSKSRINAQKHGISLEQAKRLWFSSHVQIAARTEDELRFMIIGRLDGRLYSCIFTLRKNAVRLISARRSRKEEGALYHEKIQDIDQGQSF